MGDSVLPVVADYGDQFLRLVAEGEEVACLGVLLHEQQVDDSDHLLALELGGILHDRVVGLLLPAKSIASVISFSAWGHLLSSSVALSLRATIRRARTDILASVPPFVLLRRLFVSRLPRRK
jgi:hypothetical protein